MTYTLRKGNAGQEVRRLQRTLGITPDGAFGPVTESALIKYQKNHGLAVDGIAGPQTLTAMGNAVHWGVDLSHWQGDDVDYHALREAGCGFVYLKATQGVSYRWTDWYLRNAERVVAASLPFGAYHFADPLKNGPREEWSFFNKTILRGPDDNLPGSLDMEERGLGNIHEMASWCDIWIDMEYMEGEPLPILYTGQSMIKHHFDPIGVASTSRWCDRWVPRYVDVNEPLDVSPWDEWALRQYTNKGRVPGVRGNVDINICAGGWLAGVLGE